MHGAPQRARGTSNAARSRARRAPGRARARGSREPSPPRGQAGTRVLCAAGAWLGGGVALGAWLGAVRSESASRPTSCCCARKPPRPEAPTLGPEMSASKRVAKVRRSGDPSLAAPLASRDLLLASLPRLSERGYLPLLPPLGREEEQVFERGRRWSLRKRGRMERSCPWRLGLRWGCGWFLPNWFRFLFSYKKLVIIIACLSLRCWKGSRSQALCWSGGG